MSALVADLQVSRPGFSLHLPLRVGAGEVVALLGPNGAGKTTALRAVAGLQPLSAGSVVLDGVALHRLPAERRGVGLVPQDGLLLPHLSARDNVAYGLRARGVPRADAHRRALAELERLGLGDRADVRPRALSGGQAQRVALARALVTEPALLLLDEPLAALDALTRTGVRTDLAQRLRAFAGPVLLVTHDPVDAHVLADRLVVLEHGRVVQEGPPSEVARRPRTPYVAELVGLVLLAGQVRGGRAELVHGSVPAPGVPDGPVHVAVPPEAVLLAAEPEAGSSSRPVVVRAVEQHGSQTRVLLDGGLMAVVPPSRLADLELQPGRRLWARLREEDVAVYT